MPLRDFRERAIELRAFIKGYSTAKNYGLPEYTELVMEFLDDVLNSDIAAINSPVKAQAETTSESAKSEPSNRVLPVAALAPDVKPDRINHKPSASPKLHRGRAPKITDADLPIIKQLIANGKSIEEIAAECDCSIATVHVYLKKHGIKGVSWRKTVAEDLKEEDAGEAAITIPPKPDFSLLAPEDWSDIQELLAKGRSREAIASDYDVPVEYLNGFIADRLREAQERRSGKELAMGEA